MKTQQVSVDVWAMAKSMLGYVALAIAGGLLLRLVMTALTLPSRLRQQQAGVQKAMDELRRHYPDLFDQVEAELEEEKKKKEKDSGESSKSEEEKRASNDSQDESEADEEVEVDAAPSAVVKKSN